MPKTAGMVLGKRLAPTQEIGDRLTPMGKSKRGQADATTSLEVIFL